MFKWVLEKLTDLFSFVGHGHSLEELCHRLDLDVEKIKQVPLGYHEFNIKKKSGKLRQISAPNDELKELQRRILHRLLKKLAIHPQATGFRSGTSFVDNARCHECQQVIVRIDLIDFFPSISEKQIYCYFRAIGWNRQFGKLLTKLTTLNGALPQGAPTSPCLSNLVNYRFDVSLSAITEKYNGIYTRYADDLTFSFSDDFDVHDFIEATMRFIRSCGYRPHVKKKFDVRRSHHRQIVTGLVVNERANLSRERRRWLRAVKHRMKQKRKGGYLGKQPTLTEEQLAGWQSLQQMIEKGL